MYYHSYLQTALGLVADYDGSIPLHHYLKQYFSFHKKHGSNDRRQIGRLCYSFFRTGHALDDRTPKDKMEASFFLCCNAPDPLLQALNPDWNGSAKAGLDEKCRLLDLREDHLDIFSWTDELSNGINARTFNTSHLVQPDLFLRIRPGRHEAVIQKLDAAKWPYEFIPPATVRLPNTSKADQLLAIDQEVVIQDWNSQNTGSLVEPLKKAGKKLSVWDACAASGGKSLMARDILGPVDLTVSDIRKSILYNLDKRFKTAGMDVYRQFVADLSQPGAAAPAGTPDLVIADLPCTGSGTWSRNPERLYYFKKEEIEQYANLQRAIVSTILPQLKAGASFLYITCSVFKKENEDVIDFLLSRSSLTLQRRQLFPGYDQKADTLFAALLKA